MTIAQVQVRFWQTDAVLQWQRFLPWQAHRCKNECEDHVAAAGQIEVHRSPRSVLHGTVAHSRRIIVGLPLFR